MRQYIHPKTFLKLKLNKQTYVQCFGRSYYWL